MVKNAISEEIQNILANLEYNGVAAKTDKPNQNA